MYITRTALFSTLLALVVFIPTVSAQYFGRNKPRYRTFDFKVYQTPHFEIYYYLDNPEVLNNLADHSELWYNHIQNIVKDTFYRKNPVIFFNDHADFQQTNTVSGNISVATGGVTEALKNRVTMPLSLANQKTFQVLGHELVHAFQFNIILGGDSTSLKSLGNLPLFIVEGMAEYLTRGRTDAHTAMWMRDAVLNDDIPDIDDMANPKYFPYRYGQAYWAFLTGLYGDGIINPYFRETAKYGIDIATPRVLGTTVDDLSEKWQNALRNHFTNVMGEDAKEETYGKRLIDDDNAGHINISPTVSPDGRHVIFLSEKGLFTTDLFLADTRSGKVIRKVASTLKDSDIDNLDAFESSGTWSPDSKQYAYVAFSKGRNKIVIRNVESGKQEDEIILDGITSINSPNWSRDGRYLAFTGLVQGQSDLYILDLRNKRVRQLTDDMASDLQPNWSPDGNSIVFSTDRISLAKKPKAGEWTYNLATVDVESGEVQNLDIFIGADNLNPIYDEEGHVWFLSNRDGYRNMYRYDPAADQVYQMTRLLTGISGITPYAPAISISTKRDRVVYTHYYDSKYTIYSAREEAFLNEPVAKDELDFTAAILPIAEVYRKDVVNTRLDNLDEVPVPSEERYERVPYDSKFKLDYIGGSSGVGVGSNVYGGTGVGLAGGVDMLFSDILGDNQLYTGLSLNGEIYDFGGVVSYLNRKRRVQWGVSLSHIPYRTGAVSAEIRQDPQFGEVYVQRTDLVRIFEDQLGVYARYPFSTTLRVEGNLSTTYRYFRWDQYEDIYQIFGNQLRYLTSTKEKQDPELLEDQISGLVFNQDLLHNVGGALVGDNSFFGMTSPLAGYRYRIGGSKYLGAYDFASLTLDGRKYIWAKPFSFAFRAMHYARIGEDANVFYPIFIGEMGLVRGYEFVGSTSELFTRYGLTVDQLVGSKLIMSNFEVRFPFTGPKRLAAIKSGFFFSQLNLFVDGGVAFNDYDRISFNNPEPGVGSEDFESTVVFSAGLSMRVNLFGALILEPYYAWPLRENSKGVFGLNFLPGW